LFWAWTYAVGRRAVPTMKATLERIGFSGIGLMDPDV
jgi:hypothetical protein